MEFAELARETGYEIRFIEYMPLDAQEEWCAAGVVPGAEIIEQIARASRSSPTRTTSPNRSTPYRFADGAPGRVGVIPSVTQPFCDTCNRLRLTADGQSAGLSVLARGDGSARSAARRRDATTNSPPWPGSASRRSGRATASGRPTSSARPARCR